MTPDVGRLLRLREMIQQAAESASRGEGGRPSPFAGAALAEAYDRLRSDVVELLANHPDLGGEFERLCPPFTGSPPRAQTDLFGHETFTQRATVALGQMSGWLNGIIEQARMDANAEAYAEAKLKEERGIGFKP